MENITLVGALVELENGKGKHMASEQYGESKAPKNEGDVRKWVSNWWKEGTSKGKPGITWIEFALGGSPGAPDALVPYEEKFTALELKVGEFRGSDGALLVKFRPAQINWHTEMAAGGIKTYVVIGTRMGYFCVRGRDVKRFANGECIDWPECASAISGEILTFFSMMDDEAQHAESIENYRRNVVRIEREMAAVTKNSKGLLSKPGKSPDKSSPKNARAGTASTSPAAVAKGKAKGSTSVPTISVHIRGQKGKATWPRKNDTAPKSKKARQTPAKPAAIMPQRKQPKAKSIPAPRKARSA